MKPRIGRCRLSAVVCLGSLILSLCLPCAGLSREDASLVPAGPTSGAEPIMRSAPMIRAELPSGFHTESTDGNATSKNWSGYVAESNLVSPTVGSVSDVVGSWVVPSVKPGTTDAYCTDWIGIDGHKNSTVEQVGVYEDWYDGSAWYLPWWWMYPDGGKLIPMTVRPGDVLSGEARWVSGNTFVLSLTDATTGAKFSTKQTLRENAARTCAEWIHEDPGGDPPVPFAQTTPTAFRACAATLNGTMGPIGDSLWQCTGLDMAQNGTTLEQAFPLSAGTASFVVAPPGTPPRISASGPSLTFKSTVGGSAPQTQTIVLANVGGGVLNWSAAPDSAAWLFCAPNSGGSGAPLSVWVDPTSLGVGSYTGHVVATAEGADNSPLSVPVTLNVRVPVPTTTKLGAPASAQVRRTLRLTGGISDATAPGHVTITMTRMVGKRWRNVAAIRINVVAGRFSYSFKPRYKGSWRFVASYSGGLAGAKAYESSKSVAKSVKVK